MSQTTKVVVLENHFRDVKEAITGEMLMRAAKMGGGVIETYAKLNASRGRPGLEVDTGNLVNSIRVEEDEQSETFASVNVGPSAVEYAAIHEFGGIIRPLHKQMLSWVEDGVRVFAKMVQIPARPYMRPAVDEHEDEIRQVMEATLRTQIEKAVK